MLRCYFPVSEANLAQTLNFPAAHFLPLHLPPFLSLTKSSPLQQVCTVAHIIQLITVTMTLWTGHNEAALFKPTKLAECCRRITPHHSSSNREKTQCEPKWPSLLFTLWTENYFFFFSLHAICQREKVKTSDFLRKFRKRSISCYHVSFV